MNLRKVITYIIFLGIGISLLYWRYSAIPADAKKKLIENIINAPLYAIIVTFFMGLLAVVARGLRWSLLLKPLGYEVSNLNAVSSVAFGYLANTAIPRSGEIARCTALNSTDDVPVDQLFGTVIIERVIDFIMLFIFLGIALATNFESVLSFFTMIAGKLGINISMPSGTALVMLTMSLGVIVVGISTIIKRKRSASKNKAKQSRIRGFIRGIGEGITSIKSMENRGVFVGYTLFIWLMYFLMSYYLIVEMVDGIGLFQGLWVMVSGGFGMVFPSPGGIGAYQEAVVAGFNSLGFSNIEITYAVANVIWVTQTIMLVIAGIIGSALIQRARKVF